MFNSVQLIGHLGADPEVRYFESGSNVARFTLYLNERYTNKANQTTEERTHRFTVEAWGKSAEFAANYLSKGSQVAVSGYLQENVWSTEGQNHSRITIRANRIENLTPKKSEELQTVDNAEVPVP